MRGSAANRVAPTASHSEVRVRVATYNIHHGADSADVLDLARVAKVLASLRADVIGLQEVDRHWGARSNFIDQPTWLADRLGMAVSYGVNLDLGPAEPRGDRRQYGTAVLSRFPITSSHNIALPRFGPAEQRGLHVADLDVGGIPMRFATTHLMNLSATGRRAQAKRIVQLLGDVPTRTLLTGDLNATEQAAEIAILADVFIDSWAAVGDGAGFTFSSEHPRARIDYVLASPDIRLDSAHVVSSEASDHLPLVVDLSVRD